MASRHFAGALWLITAVLLQLGVVTRLHFPIGDPNLALLTVICLALIEGPGAGLAYGFAGGLLGDLLSTHTLGRLALVWTVLGYAAGMLQPTEDRESRGALLPMIVVGVGSAAALLGYAATAVVVGDPHVPVRQIVKVAFAGGLYNLLLTPFLFPPLRGLLRRLAPSRA
ncbi:MAG TPA: rod shape-determining protein MreD [Mycobacteriales bacterium]|jgi:rod shape-determining protein MreD|nr:rod shape-determining protein MreD [Mycobacteriales bacterium]